jgi:hypothetical protein
MEAVSSYGLALMTRSAGYTKDEAEIFLAFVRKEIITRSLHCYNKMRVIPDLFIWNIGPLLGAGDIQGIEYKLTKPISTDTVSTDKNLLRRVDMSI